MSRKIGLSLFFVLWIGIILTEYLLQHDWYAKAVQFFAYYEYLLVLILGVGGTSFWLHRRKKQGIEKPIKWLNGLSLFGLSYVITLIITVLFFGNVESFSFSRQGFFQLSMYFWGLGLALWACIALCYVLGDLVLFLFPIRLPKLELRLVKIATGIMLLVGILFLLGIFHLLNIYVVLGLAAICLILNLPGMIDFVKGSLWKPIPIHAELNTLGIVAFAVTLTFVVLNFTQIIRPIPIGFDAMSLYMRLPALIGDYSGLVQGHQPYNWSIFMSLGFVVFDSAMVTMGLSYIGGLLALFALYALARRWMNPNLALLSVALFYSMPLINFFSYQDMKIDMGLLFISCCSLFLLFHSISNNKSLKEKPQEELSTTSIQQKKSPSTQHKKRSTKRSKSKNTRPQSRPVKQQIQRWPFLIAFQKKRQASNASFFTKNEGLGLLGLMLGFAIGIKFTSFILILGVLAAIWYAYGGKWSGLGAMLIGFFLVLLLKLDDFSGTRIWHSKVWITEVSVALGGILLLGYTFWKKRDQTLTNIKRSLILGSFILLSFSPWVIKNISESNQISTDALLNGKKAFPDFSQDKELMQLKKEARQERNQ